ncbi:MAG: 7-carboxy-7-deazaguanine synthase QueE [Kiritimatiellae bacterium]|nr:7-carboxy-7-deazaguanine synthase QueE [Kiritimatiellia bacterium]
MKYPVAEIFCSLQGEGFNTGREVVFLRLGGCNLACPWCDTQHSDFTMMDTASILEAVQRFGVNSLIVTGGEPLIIQGLKDLLQCFKQQGYWIAVETNGVSVADDGVLELFDYIALSPKASHAELYAKEGALRAADELRVVVDGDVRDFCDWIRGLIKARRYYLSPCEREGVMNLKQTITLLGQLNQSACGKEWLLSLQTHKLCGIR